MKKRTKVAWMILGWVTVLGGPGCNETETIYGPSGEKRARFEYVRETGDSKIMRDGSFVAWHGNGRRAFKTEYVDGALRGEVRAWHENGSLRLTGSVESTSDSFQFQFTTWHAETRAKRSEGRYVGKKPDGTIRKWYENGQKRLEGTFKKGSKQGIAREWYDNGEIKREVTYKGGMLSGPTRAWHASGELKYKGTFDQGRFDDSLTISNAEGTKQYAFELKDGMLHGMQKAWDDKGRLRWRAQYQKGKLHGDVTVWHAHERVQKWQSDAEQQKRFQATFVEGKVDGMAKQWSADGQLLARVEFERGVPDGPFKRWREEDEYLGEETPLETKGTFKDGNIDGRIQDFYPDGDPYIDAKFKEGTLKKWKMWKWGRRIDDSYRAEKFRSRLISYVQEHRSELKSKFHTVLPATLESDTHSMYLDPTADQLVKELLLVVELDSEEKKKLRRQFRSQRNEPYADPNDETLARYALQSGEAQTYFDRSIEVMERELLERRFGVEPIVEMDSTIQRVLEGAQRPSAEEVALNKMPSSG